MTNVGPTLCLGVSGKRLPTPLLTARGDVDKRGRMHCHDALVDAIRSGEADRAECLAREHAESWNLRLRKQIAEAKEHTRKRKTTKVMPKGDARDEVRR